MKATIASPAQFAEAIAWAASTSSDPRVSAVSVTASSIDGEIVVAGHDRTQAHVVAVSADVAEDGQEWIDGRMTARLFDNVSSGRIELRLSAELDALDFFGTEMWAAASIDVAPGSSGQPGPEAQWISHGAVDGGLLELLVDAAAPLAEVDGLHPVLGGIHLVGTEHELTAVACTRQVLGSFTEEFHGAEPLDVVVPALDLQRALRGIRRDPGPVLVMTAPGHRGPWIRFATPSRVASIETIDQRWPKTPATPLPIATAQVTTHNLLQALYRLELAGDDVDVHLGDRATRLAVDSPRARAQVELVSPRVGADPGPVRVSIRHLVRAIEAVATECDLLDLRTSGRHDPLVITAPDLADEWMVRVESIRPAGSVRDA